MVDVQDSSSLRLYLDETQNVADAPEDIFEDDEEMPQVGFKLQQIGCKVQQVGFQCSTYTYLGILVYLSSEFQIGAQR